MPVGTREGTDALIAGLDSLRVGIIVFNGDDRLTYSNAHFRYIFRTFDDLDAIVGLTFEDILRRLLGEGEIAGTRAINDPEGWIADTLAFHRSRDWTPRIERLSDGRWMEVKSRPLDDGGAIVHWNDVTSLMRVQMRFEAAIESTADGFAVWDQADRLVLHNRVFARLHRVAGDQLEPGITFRDFMTRTSESDVFHTGGDAAQWLDRRMEKHALPVGQSTLRHVDGRWFLMRDRHTREGGRVTVYQGVDSKLGPIDLRHQQESTNIPTADLPEFWRSKVTSGIDASSEKEAAATVERLRAEMVACLAASASGNECTK